MTKAICLLGATGSIGKSTLSIIRQHPDKFSLTSASANANVADMLAIISEFSPKTVVMVEEHAALSLERQLPLECSTKVLAGKEALAHISSQKDADIVVAGIVGIAGLLSSLSAVQAGKTLLLANKESLVVAGDFFMKAVKDGGATLLPLDSEHNAIFQCMPHSQTIPYCKTDVAKLVLTASGGPLRGLSHSQLSQVTPEQACKHPNWKMGRKISVDSATLMNKGLELIEACWMFGVDPSDVEVVVHPQSIIHSMVRYVDGSVIAQMASPDMRIPIAYGLSWPERISTGAETLDFTQLYKLEFEAPDNELFPCLSLAREAFSLGNAGPAILNAANEVSVNGFLERQISFLDIARINHKALERFAPKSVSSVESLFELDGEVRSFVARELVA